jgi:hypothetical protein
MEKYMLTLKTQYADVKKANSLDVDHSKWFDKIDDAIEPCDFEDCEEIIAKHIVRFYLVGRALAKIKDNEWYKDAGFSSFEEYCKQRWGFKRAHAYRLIGASEVINNLSPIGDTLPQTESQARELIGLDSKEMVEVWEESRKTAPNGRPTATHIKQTRERIENKFNLSHFEDDEFEDEELEEEEPEKEEVKISPSKPKPKPKSKSKSKSFSSKSKSGNYISSQIRQAVKEVFGTGFHCPACEMIFDSSYADRFNEVLFTMLYRLDQK